MPSKHPLQPADPDGHFDNGSHLRPAPHNYEAERALLGNLLITSGKAIERCPFLRSHHFADPVNGFIYEAIESLVEKGKPADPVTLKTILSGSSLVEDAGGFQYLVSLSGSAISIANTAHYASIILECSKRRDLIDLGVRMVESAYQGSMDPVDGDLPRVLNEIEDNLLKLTGTLENEQGLVRFKDVLMSTTAQWDRENRSGLGVPTGFRDVDKLLGGLHPTDLLILAGRPSMGKTALAVNIAFNAAVHFQTTQDLEHRGKQVVFFSLEMSKEQLGGRVITGQTRITAPRNRWDNPMQQSEMDRVVIAAQQFGELPFWVDDTAQMTLTKMKARLVRLHRKQRVGLVVIDYVQLMEGKKRKDDNRVEEVSAITRGLKILAKDLGCPVIALSQLNRGVESRENKRPMISDLRESGSLEQDSDIIIFPYRAEYYLEKDVNQTRKVNESNESYSNRMAQALAALEACQGKCEIIIGKNRHGPLGSVEIEFDKYRTWFEDSGDGRPEPPGYDQMELIT